MRGAKDVLDLVSQAITNTQVVRWRKRTSFSIAEVLVRLECFHSTESDTDRMVLGLRQRAYGSILVALVLAFSVASARAQNKTACELLSKADAEAAMGVALTPPRPDVGTRTQLDPASFVAGTTSQACTFTDSANGFDQVRIRIEVRYWSTPDASVPDRIRRFLDEKTYKHTTDVSGLGDAALWYSLNDRDVYLYVFRGGTVGFMVYCNKGLEKEEALALKVLTNLGGSGGYRYGNKSALKKPMLAALASKPSAIDRLKRDLTIKAEAGDAKVQLALAKLYESGELGADGNPKRDYAGAAYWYQQAADRGNAEAAYQLGFLYREGRGVAANPTASFELYRKAAESGWVPAMVPLSYIYSGEKTPVSSQRATHWAMTAANAGDPNGWLIVGYEYNKGLLGGDQSFWYRQAMDSYRKAAEGGNCPAMMNIGGLYFNGDGVPQDKNLAQKWFAKAEACQGKDIDWVREKSAKYRELAAAGHLPAVAASPAAPNGRTGVSDAQKLFAGFAALVAVAVAMDLANPPTKAGSGDAMSGKAGIDWDEVNAHNQKMEQDRQYACMLTHGKSGWGCS